MMPAHLSLYQSKLRGYPFKNIPGVHVQKKRCSFFTYSKRFFIRLKVFPVAMAYIYLLYDFLYFFFYNGMAQLITVPWKKHYSCFFTVLGIK